MCSTDENDNIFVSNINPNEQTPREREEITMMFHILMMMKYSRDRPAIFTQKWWAVKYINRLSK